MVVPIPWKIIPHLGFSYKNLKLNFPLNQLKFSKIHDWPASPSKKFSHHLALQRNCNLLSLWLKIWEQTLKKSKFYFFVDYFCNIFVTESWKKCKIETEKEIQYLMLLITVVYIQHLFHKLHIPWIKFLSFLFDST